MKLSYEDQELLRYAKALLENPGLAAKIMGLIGMPIEKALQLLPGKWAQVGIEATRRSLETALQAALLTLDDRPKTFGCDAPTFCCRDMWPMPLAARFELAASDSRCPFHYQSRFCGKYRDNKRLKVGDFLASLAAGAIGFLWFTLLSKSKATDSSTDTMD